jgi:hypothetical protein
MPAKTAHERFGQLEAMLALEIATLGCLEIDRGAQAEARYPGFQTKHHHE